MNAKLFVCSYIKKVDIGKIQNDLSMKALLYVSHRSYFFMDMKLLFIRPTMLS